LICQRVANLGQKVLSFQGFELLEEVFTGNKEMMDEKCKNYEIVF